MVRDGTLLGVASGAASPSLGMQYTHAAYYENGMGSGRRGRRSWLACQGHWPAIPSEHLQPLFFGRVRAACDQHLNAEVDGTAALRFAQQWRPIGAQRSAGSRPGRAAAVAPRLTSIHIITADIFALEMSWETLESGEQAGLVARFWRSLFIGDVLAASAPVAAPMAMFVGSLDAQYYGGPGDAKICAHGAVFATQSIYEWRAVPCAGYQTPIYSSSPRSRRPLLTAALASGWEAA